MHWRSWFREAVQRNAARSCSMIVGVGLLIGGAFASRSEVAIALVVVGAAMFVVGAFLPWIESFSINGEGVNLTTRHERDCALALAAEASEDADAIALDDGDEVLDAMRFIAGSAAIDELLSPPRHGPLAACDLQLFLYDDDMRKLMPAFESEDAEPIDGWLPGRGVTGEAYATGEYAIAEGPEASDASHGLTRAQQQRYRETAAVAAMPVLNRVGAPIAVLSASTHDEHNGLGTADGFDEHLIRAQAVARVLVDQLRWFSDDEQGE